MLTLATKLDWEIHQVDVNNAFLHGTLHEVVYMMQREGFTDPSRPTHVCQLHKALYEITQAPGAWFEKLKVALLAWGFKFSTFDSIFVLH